MTINEEIRDEKIQNNIDKKAVKNQHYHQLKLINMSALQVKKYYLQIKVKLWNKTKFTYSPLGKALEKQTKEIEQLKMQWKNKRKQLNVESKNKP